MSDRPLAAALCRLLAGAALAAALLGCRERVAPDKEAGVAPPPRPRALDPTTRMRIVVTSVHADPTLDQQAIRASLRDAETALLLCADDDGSTGVLVMKIAIERDGFVGDIALRETTTYGSDDARACFQRIVSALRFVSPGDARAEAEVTLEVQTRFGGM